MKRVWNGACLGKIGAVARVTELLVLLASSYWKQEVVGLVKV